MDELFTKWSLFSKVLQSEHFSEKQIGEVIEGTSVKPGVFFVRKSYKTSRFAIVVRYYSFSEKWNRIRKYIDEAGLNRDEFKFSKDVMIIIAYEQVQNSILRKVNETLTKIYQTDEIQVTSIDDTQRLNSGIGVNFPPELNSEMHLTKNLFNKLEWHCAETTKHTDGTFTMRFFPGYETAKEIFNLFRYDF